MAKYAITVNGRAQSVEAGNPDMPLLWVLRDTLGLTGTKYGCGAGACGACTVHVDGQATRSCQVPIQAAAGRKITTIEGLSEDGRHPCQLAWLAEDVAQCGYCQPGMIMTTAALVAGKKPAGQDQIEAALSAHICRCGTYGRMQKAVARAAAGDDAMSATRRQFIRNASLGAAALALPIPLFGQSGKPGAAGFSPSQWLRIGKDGRTVLVVAHSEMGQGVRTSLAMILAEELEADWKAVVIEQASPGPLFTDTGTGGSDSVTSSWKPLREAGAAAREMLIEAAAKRWSVPPSTCRAEMGDGDPRGVQPQGRVRRARRGGRGASGAESAASEGRERLSPDRNPRVPHRRTGHRLGPRRVRDRHARAGHAVRGRRRVSGSRREARAVRGHEGEGRGRRQGRGDHRGRRRRPGGRHLRGALRPRRARRGLGRRRERQAHDRGALEAHRSRGGEPGALEPQGGRRGRGPRRFADEAVGDLSDSVPGARHARAGQHDRKGRGRRLRDLVAHAVSRARAEGRGEAARDRAREGDRARDAARRRLRPAPRLRLRDAGRGDRAGGEAARPARLVARRRFPAGPRPSGRPRGPGRRARRVRPHRRMDPHRDDLSSFDVRSVQPRGRSGRQPVGRLRHPVRHSQPRGRLERDRIADPHGRLAGGLLPGQRLRARMLPRRDRREGRKGSAGFAAGAALRPLAVHVRQAQDRPGRPRARAEGRGREVGLGIGARPPRGTARRAAGSPATSTTAAR